VLCGNASEKFSLLPGEGTSQTCVTEGRRLLQKRCERSAIRGLLVFLNAAGKLVPARHRPQCFSEHWVPTGGLARLADCLSGA
jgi:hypothetical protein